MLITYNFLDEISILYLHNKNNITNFHINYYSYEMIKNNCCREFKYIFKYDYNIIVKNKNINFNELFVMKIISMCIYIYVFKNIYCH